MTQNTVMQRGGSRLTPPLRRPVPPLSLGRSVPAGWHDDRPAYAGDPDMDWESKPEPPAEPRWDLAEPGRPHKH
jgi:hypothetical protein